MLWEVDPMRVYHVHTKTFHLATPILCSGPKPGKIEKWRLTVKRAIYRSTLHAIRRASYINKSNVRPIKAIVLP